MRKTTWFFSRVQLEFGRPSVGTLMLEQHVANKLVAASSVNWP